MRGWRCPCNGNDFAERSEFLQRIGLASLATRPEKRPQEPKTLVYLINISPDLRHVRHYLSS